MNGTEGRRPRATRKRPGAKPGGGREGLARAAHESDAARRAFTFFLDPGLVERARREVGEGDVVRSIEAALAAAIDYNLWVREVAAGRRDVLG